MTDINHGDRVPLDMINSNSYIVLLIGYELLILSMVNCMLIEFYIVLISKYWLIWFLVIPIIYSLGLSYVNVKYERAPAPMYGSLYLCVGMLLCVP